MKCLFLTEGGRGKGFGHLTRCLALAQGLERKVRTIKFIVNGDKNAESLLDKQNINTVMMSWIKERKRIKKIAANFDIIIVDSYKASRLFYLDLAQTKSYVVAIDDYNRVDYRVDMVVNPSIYGDKLKYKICSKSKYLLGKNYLILRREFWRVPKKTINRKVKNVLIVFGGGRHANFIKKLISYLSNVYPKLNYHIVSGESNFNSSIDQRLNINIYSNLSASEMRNLMFKCDIAISGGGQTTYELARVGIPAIGVCFADNQRLNLTAGKKHGFIDYIGKYDSSQIFSRLMRSMNLLMDYQERVRRNEIGRNCINSKGVERIAKALVHN